MQAQPESPSDSAISQQIPYLLHQPLSVPVSGPYKGSESFCCSSPRHMGGYCPEFFVSMSDPPSPIVGMTRTSPKKQTTTSFKQQAAPSHRQPATTSAEHQDATSSKRLATSSSTQQASTSCKCGVAPATSSKWQTAPCHTQQATTFCKCEGARTTSSSSMLKSSRCSNQHAKRVAFLLRQKKSEKICGSPVDLGHIRLQK